MKTTISLITATHIIQASKTMSKDHTRLMLNGVSLKNDGENLTIIATDGYSAIKQVVLSGALENLPEKGIIINSSAIELIKLRVKQAKKDKMRDFDFEFDGRLHIINREYPRTEVFFNTKADHFEIAFSEEVLKTAMASLVTKEKNKIVRFKFTSDNLKPVILSCANDGVIEQKAIAMPCKF